MKAGVGSKVHFREVQQFRQPWLWVLMGGIALSTVNVMGYGMVKQLVLGQPWGDKPMSDLGLAVFGPAMMLVGTAPCALFYLLKLVTEVGDEGVTLQFVPLPRKTIRFEEIARCEARTYRPIADYGGWGIKMGRAGRAYTVSGNRGVMLELAGGKRLLIGSQQAEALAQAIAGRLGRQA